MVALHTMKALQEIGWKVSIVTDNYNPEEVEQNFRMGEVLRKCEPIEIPPFRPLTRRFLALQRLRYAKKVRELTRELRPDVVFSTQSVIYYIPGIRTFHIVYDMADLFEIIPGEGPLSSRWKRPYYRLLRPTFQSGLTSNRLFVPLSHSLEQRLSALRYPHSTALFPPCDMIFRPGLKRKQVCLVSRIAPQKNIEGFMEIAGKSPNCHFVLVGVETEVEQSYSKRVLSTKPSNVEYVEVRIRDRPEIVEESKVYLYTSTEPGIGIALGQAMGAGCIPVTPARGGGAEMVSESGVGYTYRDSEEASGLVLKAIESSESRDLPGYISGRAQIFSSECFRTKIEQLARGETLDQFTGIPS